MNSKKRSSPDSTDDSVDASSFETKVILQSLVWLGQNVLWNRASRIDPDPSHGFLLLSLPFLYTQEVTTYKCTDELRSFVSLCLTNVGKTAKVKEIRQVTFAIGNHLFPLFNLPSPLPFPPLLLFLLLLQITFPSALSPSSPLSPSASNRSSDLRDLVHCTCDLYIQCLRRSGISPDGFSPLVSALFRGRASACMVCIYRKFWHSVSSFFCIPGLQTLLNSICHAFL